MCVQMLCDVSLIPRSYLFLLFAYNCSKHLRIHEFDLAVFSKDWMGSLLSALLLIYASELLVDWYVQNYCT